MSQFAIIKRLISQSNWLVVVLTLLVFSGLIKLGLWQSARAVEKEQRLLRIAKLVEQQALSLDEVLVLAKKGENINDLPIHLAGTFDAKRVLLLDNQVHKRSLGYRVLQFVQTAQGLVLVNLGWVEGAIDRNQLPLFEPISGTQQFNGNIRIVEQGILLAQQNYDQTTWPKRIQQVELMKLSQLFGQKVLPFMVYLDKKETIGFEKNWQPIVMPPEKHRGYAFQWFSLAVTWLALMIWASRVFNRNKNNNKKESYESGAVE